MSIDAPGPAKRSKRYCDITGYEVIGKWRDFGFYSLSYFFFDNAWRQNTLTKAQASTTAIKLFTATSKD